MNNHNSQEIEPAWVEDDVLARNSLTACESDLSMENVAKPLDSSPDIFSNNFDKQTYDLMKGYGYEIGEDENDILPCPKG